VGFGSGQGGAGGTDRRVGPPWGQKKARAADLPGIAHEGQAAKAAKGRQTQNRIPAKVGVGGVQRLKSADAKDAQIDEVGAIFPNEDTVRRRSQAEDSGGNACRPGYCNRRRWGLHRCCPESGQPVVLK